MIGGTENIQIILVQKDKYVHFLKNSRLKQKITLRLGKET